MSDTKRTPPAPVNKGIQATKVYRVPGSKGYAGTNPASVVPFASETEAQQARYRRAKDCP
jgi:hypothetical protein